MEKDQEMHHNGCALTNYLIEDYKELLNFLNWFKCMQG